MLYTSNSARETLENAWDYLQPDVYSPQTTLGVIWDVQEVDFDDFHYFDSFFTHKRAYSRAYPKCEI